MNNSNNLEYVQHWENVQFTQGKKEKLKNTLHNSRENTLT